MGPPSRLVAVGLAVSLACGGCARSKARSVNLGGAPRATTAVARQTTVGTGALRFAIAMPFSPHESYSVYKDLADLLSERLGRQVHLTFRRSFAEVNDLLRSHQADFVQLCDQGYQRGHGGFGLRAIAVPRAAGARQLPSYVIMPAGHALDTLLTLAVAEPNCAPGPAGQVGATRKIAIKGHDRAIRAVREGLVDAALVDGFAYQRALKRDPALRSELRIIGQTPAYQNPPVAVHPALDPRVRRALAAAFKDLHRSDRGRKILEELGADRFEAL